MSSVWYTVKASAELASSGNGWTELSSNGNGAASAGLVQSANCQGGSVGACDFATLGAPFPHGTMLTIVNPANGKSGTFPLTDVGNGSSFGPAIGLTPAVQGALGLTGGSFIVNIALANGNTMNVKGGFGSAISGPGVKGVVPGTGAAGGGSSVTSNTNQAGQFFYIGDVNNPDEDYWTGINRWAQLAQWYLFSDGETLYVADGYRIMAQVPSKVIDRWADPKAQNPNSNILHCSMTYDNTAWSYAATHKKRGKIQRKSTLSKVTSPTEITMDIICKIDEIRAGDTVFLKNFGLANGAWLVGNCTRSIFLTYSELTLVPAIIPLNVGSSGTGASSSSGTPGTPGGVSPGAVINNAQLGPTTNPVPGAVPNRLDQGFDVSAKAVYAPFNGKVVASVSGSSGWGGGGIVSIQSTNDPSMVFYAAENWKPTVNVGASVRVGQQIAIAYPYGAYGNGAGVGEIGRANPSAPTQPLAQVVSNPSQMVLSFAKWLQSLGGPAPTSTGNAGSA